MYKLLRNPVKRLPTWLLVRIGNEIKRGEVPDHIKSSIFPSAIDNELEERCKLELLSEEDTSTTHYCK